MLLRVLRRATSSSFTHLNCNSEKINVTTGIKQGNQLLVHLFDAVVNHAKSKLKDISFQSEIFGICRRPYAPRR